MTYSIEPLGYISTCFPEKFGTPRQPLLVSEAKGELLLLPPYNQPECVEGLTTASHVWLSFIFHRHLDQGWKPKVRPPRLGGHQKCGVFATRSPFRPNALGLSAVKLDAVLTDNRQVRLLLSGVDLVDGTPIVDIKPYVPYVDAIPQAVNRFAVDAPTLCPVIFSEQAEQFCRDYSAQEKVFQLITQVLQQDPRPAYHLGQASQESPLDSRHALPSQCSRHYKMKLLDFDIEWGCELQQKGISTITVFAINPIQR